PIAAFRSTQSLGLVGRSAKGEPARMGATVLSEFATEVVVPVCAVVGIVFSLVQWYLVARVKVTTERHGHSSSPRSDNNGNNKNGCGDYLIEEEEGINDHNVVVKCAEIQNAISEGLLSALDLKISLRSASSFLSFIKPCVCRCNVLSFH
ncbi:hypothetical protein CR513_51482, partial [Mucuna pruriens]